MGSGPTDHFSICPDFISVFLCVPAGANGFSFCDPVMCTGQKMSAIVTLSY